MSKTFDDILEHYGVKGQQWGVRRSKRQRAKAAKTMAKEGKTTKGAFGTKPNSVKKDEDKTRYKESPKKLTMDELNTRIKRMETEKRYTELNKRTVGQGERVATEILTSVGKSTATKVLTGTAAYAAKKAIAKKTSPETAEAILPKKKK